MPIMPKKKKSVEMRISDWSLNTVIFMMRMYLKNKYVMNAKWDSKEGCFIVRFTK